MRLEDLQPRCTAWGVHPDTLITVRRMQWYGSEALESTCKIPAAAVANELLNGPDGNRRPPTTVELRRRRSAVPAGLPAQRIRLAHLFDPVLAVHTSLVESLPHHFMPVCRVNRCASLLADEPSAGTTIMQRCLSSAPAALDRLGGKNVNPSPAVRTDQPQACSGPNPGPGWADEPSGRPARRSGLRAWTLRHRQALVSPLKG